jgi:O-antigen ligase
VLAYRGARLPVHPQMVVAAAIAGSILAGTAMAHSVQLGVAAVVALCFGPLVLVDLPLGVVLWIPSTSLIAVSALDVGPNLAGILILFAWLGALAMGYSTVPAALLQNARLLWLVGALVFWVLLSIAWEQRSVPPGSIVVNWLVVAAIMLVIPATITDRRYVRLAIGAMVAGVVVSIGIGLFGGGLQPESDRLVGGSGDPNFLAAGCVPAIVLATGLGAGAERRVVRWALAAAAALATIGVAASASRGGFLAAIVAAVGSILLIKHARARIIAFVLYIVAVAVVYFSLNPAAWQRIVNFKDDSGRGELWSVAWHMWQDHPLAGVGLDGFLAGVGDYARDLGPLKYAEFLTEQPKYVHNTFLEVLVETGVVGLVLYLLVVAACMRCAWRAAQRFEELRDPAMATLARALIVSVLAMLTAAFFISGATDRRLWVLLALGPALLAAARATNRPSSPPAPAPASAAVRTHPASDFWSPGGSGRRTVGDR